MNELPTPQNPTRHRMIAPTEPIVTESTAPSISKPDMVPRSELERVERERDKTRTQLDALAEAVDMWNHRGNFVPPYVLDALAAVKDTPP